MRVLLFEEVASLINKSRVTNIDLDPAKEDKGKWALYHGINSVPHFKYDFCVMYLHSDATKETIRDAAEVISDPTITQIVYAQSLLKKFKEDDIRAIFPKGMAGIRSTKAYFNSFIQDQLKEYRGKLSSIKKPDDFVERTYTAPDGFRHKFPNPLRMFLDAPKREDFEGGLAIVIGEPGQGKTYSAQHLVSELLGQNISVPIYIDSRQWSELLRQKEDLASIWKTITYSFKYYECPIDWIDGSEEDFLRICLKSDLFRIVFDGFDEYILWNQGKVDANETIKTLLNFSHSSGSSLMLTSRTSFWESNIDKSQFSVSKITPEIYQLMPFDRNHATNYFKKKFSQDNNKISRALSIYDAIKDSGGENIVGRGFILYLIADLVNRTDTTPSLVSPGYNCFQWLIEALCEREETRQKLPINKDQQLRILRAFAEIVSSGWEPITDSLKDVIQMQGLALSDTDIEKLIGNVKTRKKQGSLQDHPLIYKIKGTDRWEFIHEQIRFHLLAQQLMEYSKDSGKLVESFIRGIKEDGRIFTEIATSFAGLIISSNDSMTAVQLLGHVISLILDNSKSDHIGKQDREGMLSFATTICMVAVNKLCKTGVSHLDKTNMLLQLLNSESINNMIFSGTIGSYNFSGIMFNNCVFNQVVWNNCDYDEHTTFSNCNFRGGRIVNSIGFGKTKMNNIVADVDADIMINAEKIKVGKKKYGKSDLKVDIGYLIEKFISKGGVGFRVLAEKDLKSGKINISPHRDEICEAFKKGILEEYYGSSASGRKLQICEEHQASVYSYINNGVFSGGIAELYERLLKKIT